MKKNQNKDYTITQANVFINGQKNKKIDYYKAITDVYDHVDPVDRRGGSSSARAIGKSIPMGLKNVVIELKVWIIQDKYKNSLNCPDKEYNDIYREMEKVLLYYEVPYEIKIDFILPNDPTKFYLRGCDDEETTTTFVGFTPSESEQLKKRIIFRPSAWDDSPDIDRIWSIPQSPAFPESYYAKMAALKNKK